MISVVDPLRCSSDLDHCPVLPRLVSSTQHRVRIVAHRGEGTCANIVFAKRVRCYHRGHAPFVTTVVQPGRLMIAVAAVGCNHWLGTVGSALCDVAVAPSLDLAIERRHLHSNAVGIDYINTVACRLQA